MEYTILDMNLKEINWKSWYSRKSDRFWDQGIPQEVQEIPDNYDDKEDYGLYQDDDLNAICHARFITKQYRKDNVSHSKGEQLMYRKAMKRDLINYLHCMSLCTAGNPKVAKWLIAGCARVRVDEQLCDILYDYWEDYKESLKGKWGGCDPLDFPDLYRACGDKALFDNHNPALAKRFYQLAELHWPTEEEETTEGENTELPMSEKFTWKQEKMNNLLTKEDFYERLENLNHAAQLYEERIISILSEIGKAKTIRALFELTLLLFQQNLFVVLYCLSYENSKVQEKYRKRAMDAIRANREDQMKPLRQYMLWSNADYKDVLLFARITGCTYMIRNALLMKDSKHKMAYYTSLDTFRFMLPERAQKESGHFSVMHMAYMNDPNEGRTILRFLRRGSGGSGNETRKSVEYPYVFMKCFTSLIDDLPMWEMYGDSAKGCCIVLTKEGLYDPDEEREIPLYRVCYIAKQSGDYRILEEHNPHIADVAVLQQNLEEIRNSYEALDKQAITERYFQKTIAPIRYLFKDAAYSHEQEIRLLYQFNSFNSQIKQTDGNFPMLYVETDFLVAIEELIFGPKVSDLPAKVPYLQSQIEQMCESLDIATPELTVSSIEYR